jgi:hypothetical protein
MIATILPCEYCGRVEITGELPAANGYPPKRLCAVHFALSISNDKWKANPELIRRELKKSLLKQSEYLAPSLDKATDLV